MAAEILWAGVLGVVAILVFGGLLALGARYLPHLLRQQEAGAEGKWGLGDLPGPFEQAAPGPAQDRERPPVVLPPREPLANRLGMAPEEPLLAAAIGLALTLYQQEQGSALETGTTPGPGSAWAWSGRWQAMQGRLNRQKR